MHTSRTPGTSGGRKHEESCSTVWELKQTSDSDDDASRCEAWPSASHQSKQLEPKWLEPKWLRTLNPIFFTADGRITFGGAVGHGGEAVDSAAVDRAVDDAAIFINLGSLGICVLIHGSFYVLIHSNYLCVRRPY